eukprot:364267-Chlamydomonas_euryale.AAC.10
MWRYAACAATSTAVSHAPTQRCTDKPPSSRAPHPTHRPITQCGSTAGCASRPSMPTWRWRTR